MRYVVCLLVCVLALAARGEAADRMVCASGCPYSNLQAAIDEAAPGDTILLRAGETFVGNFLLRAKSGTAVITIRSDAPAVSLPAAGSRLIPPGRPGANTARSAMARLLGQNGTYKPVPVVRTAAGAHHYRLQFLDIDGTSSLGYETIVSLGVNDSSQTTAAAVPYAIVLDRVWIHGHPTKGAKRGLALNGRAIDVLNSYIDDVFSLPDSQGIAGFNGPGPFRIINNHIEASAENILFGGADPKIRDLVPSDIEIRANDLYKKPAWRNPVLSTPARPAASAGAGGALAAGTHYFKVAAVMTAGADAVQSAASPEAAVTVGANGSAQLSWPAVAGAERYRVYRGTASNGQRFYLETTARSITYLGSAEKSATPLSTGRKWTAKNLLELKSAQRVVIDGNVLENNWKGFQDGSAVLFTPRNQEGTAPWTVVRDITFSNNRLRASGGGINLHGYDNNNVTLQTRDIRILNNVFEQLGGDRGLGRFLQMTSGAANITVDHNTIDSDGTLVVVSGPAVAGFTWTNNFTRHDTYGIIGQETASGLDTLNHFMPGWRFVANVLAGGRASFYPPGNYFPADSEFAASFVDRAAGDYRLVASSPYRNQASDGRDIGVDIGALMQAQATRSSGTSTPEEPPAEPPGGTLPDGWESEDVGAVNLAGSATQAAGTFVVTGSGNDIWNNADEFHFAYRALSGDGVIVARVASLTGVDGWTKAGVMVRARADAGAAHAFMLVSRGKGLAFQRRRSDGGASTHTSGGSGTAPRWVKLTRAGQLLSAYASVDGSTWTLVGSDTIALPSDALVGLAVNGHDTLATAAFDNVSITSGQSLPAAWSSADIGVVAKPGMVTDAAGTITVKGAGADIWGTADGLHFASRQLAGDGRITARVAAITGTQPWTKVGVMMRQTLDAGSAHALMLVSTGKGLAFQRRTVTGGTSTHTSGGSGTAPQWVRLTRAGQVITASISSDGQAWTVVGTDTLGLVGTVHVGLAVSSHDDTLATGVFDNVTVTP